MQHAIGTAANVAPSNKIKLLHSMQTSSLRRASKVASTLTLLAALAVVLVPYSLYLAWRKRKDVARV